MTHNQQCVSNQKIQTACPYGRANRSVGQAVFLALNDGQTGQFTVRIKADFGHFLSLYAVYEMLAISDIPAWENAAQSAKRLFFLLIHMDNIHTWIIHMWQIKEFCIAHIVLKSRQMELSGDQEARHCHMPTSQFSARLQRKNSTVFPMLGRANYIPNHKTATPDKYGKSI